jgi:transcription elongation GreA/GreB family factor
MSRAFVKENDEESAAGELPERPLADYPNYVTPRGLVQLRERLAALHAERDRLAAADEAQSKQRMLEVKRDIRYFAAQIDRAVAVDPAAQPHGEVRFGATVTLVDEDGRQHRFQIVGDDEAEPVRKLISWATPLARALIGARIGDRVQWPRPGEATELEVAAIDYGAVVKA